MKLRFLGTRGEIDTRTRRHGRHSSLEVSYYGHRAMIDAGEDWRGHLDEVAPHAIVVTHSHPDHAWGLKDGAPCAVWATAVTWQAIDGYPIAEEDRRRVEPREAFEPIDDVRFEAFTLEHSTRAPAVGYRVEAGRRAVFYVPDVAYIHEREAALDGVDLYIGDGATMARSMVRRQDDALVGHVPVRTQLTWCADEGVPVALITHCGSQIVEGDERHLGARLRSWAEERGVEAGFAHDGMVRVLR